MTRVCVGVHASARMLRYRDTKTSSIVDMDCCAWRGALKPLMVRRVVLRFFSHLSVLSRCCLVSRDVVKNHALFDCAFRWSSVLSHTSQLLAVAHVAGGEPALPLALAPLVWGSGLWQKALGAVSRGLSLFPSPLYVPRFP